MFFDFVGYICTLTRIKLKFNNMAVTANYQKTFTKRMVCFYLFLICTTSVFAQKNNNDTTQKILLADAHLKKEAVYFMRPANVVYPEILKASQEPAADYIANYSNDKRNYLLTMHERGRKILPKVNAILKKYELPEELSFLMMLESAFNANVISKAGAVGYWQIMDIVARQYGMKYVQKINSAEKKKLIGANAKTADLRFKKMILQKDERNNFEKSTITAARYLSDSRKVFDDNWLLVVASYNCGIGNVLAAIKKTKKGVLDFWQIKRFLPAETQAYVMNFIALNVIYKNYNNFVSNNLNFTPVRLLIPDNFQQNMTEEVDGPSEN